MKNIYILVPLIIIVSIITVLGILILDNNQKINPINNPEDLAKIFLEATKKQDLKTLEFFNCRITKDYQEQSDFDRALKDYLEYSKKIDYTKVKIVKLENDNFEIINLEDLDTKKKTSRLLKINKQKPLYNELRIKESFCFE